MNKHSIASKMRSIDHYYNELKLLSEAKSATESTIESILEDLKEAIPFEDNDIIIKGTTIRMFKKVKKVSRFINEFRFYIDVLLPQDYGWSNRLTEISMTYAEIQEWTVVSKPQ